MARRVGLTYSAGRPDKAEPYRDALHLVGLEVVDNPKSIDDLDGLLISGGVDVDPALYGQAPAPETSAPEPERDDLEATLIRMALTADLPVLCICRGAQILNVVYGGSLIQHIVSGAHKSEHTVDVKAGTKLAGIVGAGTHPVNSRHHQAIDRIGVGLRAAATAPDGTIEAIESPVRRFAVALQWHPEDRVRTSDSDRSIFEAFAKAVETS